MLKWRYWLVRLGDPPEISEDTPFTKAVECTRSVMEDGEDRKSGVRTPGLHGVMARQATEATGGEA